MSERDLKKDVPLEIIPVNNGFIVRRTTEDSRFMESISIQLVFQTFAELIGFLEESFTHRKNEVLTDPQTPVTNE